MTGAARRPAAAARHALRRVLPALLLVAAAGPAPRFEPVQPELFALGGSLANAWADYDGDGDLDLYVGFGATPGRLYRNGGAAFADVAAESGIARVRGVRASSWGDFDGDGDPDLLLGRTTGAGPVLVLFRNDRASFTDVTAASGLTVDSAAVRQPVWLDLDGDGDLDLFVAFRDRPNALYRNDGGRFTDVAAERGVADPRRSVGAVWFDFEEDGDLDLYVGNMDGDANGLFRNDGGRFTDVAAEVGLAWGGRRPGDAGDGTVRPCVADVDGDGRLDIFTANYGPNGLFLNRGGGRFEDVSAAWGIAIDSRDDTCAFADIDHDGRVDLYVNGTVTGGVDYRDYLFRNTGATMLDVTPPELSALKADHGAQWADFDGDGDVDLALTGAQPDGMHLLFRNLLPAPLAGRSVRVRVLDAAGRATLAGAEVRAFAAGTRRVVATSMVDAGSGYNGQNDQPVHLGLADSSPVDIEVTYPVGGRRVVARSTDQAPAAGAVVTIRLQRP